MLRKFTLDAKIARNGFLYLEAIFNPKIYSKQLKNCTQYVKLKVEKVKVPLFFRLDKWFGCHSPFFEKQYIPLNSWPHCAYRFYNAEIPSLKSAE